MLSLEDVISKHKAGLLIDFPCRLTIRRDRVFEDALMAILNNNWDEKQIKINFLGEPAIDYGGPTREFFSLLLKEIENNNSLLDGCHNRRILRHNSTAIQVGINARMKGKCYTVAMCSLHVYRKRSFWLLAE